MNCERCGGPVDDMQKPCGQCTNNETKMSVNRSAGKVIPFRPRKKTHKSKNSRRVPRASTTTWWIIGIVTVSLIAPYVTPLIH